MAHNIRGISFVSSQVVNRLLSSLVSDMTNHQDARCVCSRLSPDVPSFSTYEPSHARTLKFSGRSDQHPLGCPLAKTPVAAAATQTDCREASLKRAARLQRLCST